MFIMLGNSFIDAIKPYNDLILEGSIVQFSPYFIFSGRFNELNFIAKITFLQILKRRFNFLQTFICNPGITFNGFTTPVPLSFPDVPHF